MSSTALLAPAISALPTKAKVPDIGHTVPITTSSTQLRSSTAAAAAACSASASAASAASCASASCFSRSATTSGSTPSAAWASASAASAASALAAASSASAWALAAASCASWRASASAVESVSVSLAHAAASRPATASRSISKRHFVANRVLLWGRVPGIAAPWASRAGLRQLHSTGRDRCTTDTRQPRTPSQETDIAFFIALAIGPIVGGPKPHPSRLLHRPQRPDESPQLGRALPRRCSQETRRARWTRARALGPM